MYEDEEEMLVSLEQEDRRSSNFRTRGENYCIGFTITKARMDIKDFNSVILCRAEHGTKYSHHV